MHTRSRRKRRKKESQQRTGEDEDESGHLFSDLQCPLAQWLCLLVFAPFAIQHSQIVECGSHLQRKASPITHSVANESPVFSLHSRVQDNKRYRLLLVRLFSKENACCQACRPKFTREKEGTNSKKLVVL